MGYIFDALNRAGDEDPVDKDGQELQVPAETDAPSSADNAGDLSGDDTTAAFGDFLTPEQLDQVGPSPATDPSMDVSTDDASGFTFEAVSPIEADPPAYEDTLPPDTSDESPVASTDNTDNEVDEQPPPPPLETRPTLALSEVDDMSLSSSQAFQVTQEWLDEIDDRLVALSNPSSVMAEEYRSIRTSLLARWQHKRHLVHTITSATPQEGKTITSLNLGLSFAELHNRSTIVIEADLRLPTFEKLLKLGPHKGLVNYLHGEAELSELTQTIGEGGLNLITAGERAHNDSVQLLSSQRMVNLLELLRAKYDHVIIDTPPVVELADAGILGGHSDDVILIARMNRTPRSLIDQAIRTLSSYNAPVAGMIATDQKRLRRRYYYYRYGYRYRYRYYTKQAV